MEDHICGTAPAARLTADNVSEAVPMPRMLELEIIHKHFKAIPLSTTSPTLSPTLIDPSLTRKFGISAHAVMSAGIPDWSRKQGQQSGDATISLHKDNDSNSDMPPV